MKQKLAIALRHALAPELRRADVDAMIISAWMLQTFHSELR